MYRLDAVCIIYIIIMRYSVKYQLSVRKFNGLVSPEQNIASTQIFHQKIHLRRLIPHTKLYAHTLFIRMQREGRSSMSSFQLSDRYFIIGFPLLAIFQLLDASNTTAHHPSVV